MARPCEHRDPVQIVGELRLSGRDEPVAKRSVPPLMWCTRCGALGYDGSWCQPSDALAHEQPIEPR